MSVLWLGQQSGLCEDVSCIYEEYKDRISRGKLMMLSPPGGEEKFYVYDQYYLANTLISNARIDMVSAVTLIQKSTECRFTRLFIRFRNFLLGADFILPAIQSPPLGIFILCNGNGVTHPSFHALSWAISSPKRWSIDFPVRSRFPPFQSDAAASKHNYRLTHSDCYPILFSFNFRENGTFFFRQISHLLHSIPPCHPRPPVVEFCR